MTFAELGIPFPLFEAPVEEAFEYQGTGTCCVCKQKQAHCFELDDLVLACSSCGAVNGLRASDNADTPCIACAKMVPWPLPPETAPLICYTCLRGGFGALIKSTELGLVTWERAVEGVTGTVASPPYSSGFEPISTRENWVSFRVPSQHMFELLRTPRYFTLQEERWQFCCRQPMVYLGEWSREEFTKRSPDGDGESFFRKIVIEVVPRLWEDELHDITGVYVFRCAMCARLTANWDLS